jgi:serine/threonine-protein kinase
VSPLQAATVADVTRQLGDALRDRYVLERELGRGGMATVYLAHDVRHDRSVAVKVLRPELALTLGPERFLREIKLAARLQHPHILPVFDSGEAAGALWYAMPLVEGDSLRDRLAREGELPVADAVAILRDVTAALAYAHRHGVIHRDIKPANVLLSEGGALVADFGVAKAAADSGITTTGLAIGTPAYMAPEQAIGDGEVDHRADLYGLGVVAYELLTGHIPFVGRSPQALLAAHASAVPEPIIKQRPTVPPALAHLVMRLLEKHPADRPQSADEVLRVLEETARSISGTATVPVSSRAPSRGRWMVAGGVVATALVLSLAAIVTRKKPAPMDPGLVAIGPFRVSSADSSLAYLREGMVDLLATKLSGTAELRSADPRTVLSAWRRADAAAGDVSQSQALAVAARLGAGRLVEGEVVGSREQLAISAALLDVGQGRVTVRAGVEGPADSLTRLVDQLAGKLLALGAGESDQRLASLTSTSLPALRAYLDGRVLLRRGLFEAAVAKLDQAIQLDSGFALAGLAEAQAGEWLDRGWIVPASVLAWQHRDRLSPRDRDQLAALVGPNFPQRSSLAEYLAAADHLTKGAPDSPEAWYKVGDLLYHYGTFIGIPDALERSRAAFARSLALDSSFAPALEHGPQLAFELGDSAGMRRATAQILRLDSITPLAAYQVWYMATVTGDTSRARAALEDDGLSRRASIVSTTALTQGIDLRGAGAAIERWQRAAVTQEERRASDVAMYAHLLQVGRSTQALPFLASALPLRRNVTLAYDGLFGDGDSTAAAGAVAELARDLGSPITHPNFWILSGRYLVAQYALANDRMDVVRRVIADLDAAPERADTGLLRGMQAAAAHDFALLLEAQVAARQGSPRAPELLARLDSLLLSGQQWVGLAGNFVASRLHEERGELPAALAAVRRRVFDLYDIPMYVTYYREEGRLAALTGDRVGAARAYRRYLAVRIDPEPRLRSQVAQVRDELRAVEHGSTDR